MIDKNVAVKAAVLVVGTGPAGGTAALALARLGVDVMVINKYPWTAPTPRSHITNQRTVEVLRDIGLADEALPLATSNDLMGENAYCTSLAGEEIGRLRTWGTQPQRRSDYELASPERICDLPQNLLEPLLVGAAARHGARVASIRNSSGASRTPMASRPGSANATRVVNTRSDRPISSVRTVPIRAWSSKQDYRSKGGWAYPDRSTLCSKPISHVSSRIVPAFCIG